MIELTQTNDSISLTQFDYIGKSCGFEWVKDKQLICQNISKDLANGIGWRSIDDAVGKTDHDIPCSNVAVLADRFIELDKELFDKKNKVFLKMAHCTLQILSILAILIKHILILILKNNSNQYRRYKVRMESCPM